jgi:hypothetical protein
MAKKHRSKKGKSKKKHGKKHRTAAQKRATKKAQRASVRARKHKAKSQAKRSKSKKSKKSKKKNKSKKAKSKKQRAQHNEYMGLVSKMVSKGVPLAQAHAKAFKITSRLDRLRSGATARAATRKEREARQQLANLFAGIGTAGKLHHHAMSL